MEDWICVKSELLSLVDSYLNNFNLGEIPTIGPRGFFGSYLGAIKYLSRGREMVEEGYYKYPGGAFKVPLIDRWIVYVNGPKMIDDIRRASDENLSFPDAVLETLQSNYTMGKELRTNMYHIDVVRNALTRNIAARFADIKDEIECSFEDEVPVKNGVYVHVLPIVMRIVARTTNRLFVGLPLCRVPEWRDININFTIKVFMSAQFINLFPAFLKPIVGRLFSPLHSTAKVAKKHLEPLVKERLAKEKEYGSKDWPDKPNDLISWLLELAGPEQRNAYDLTLRILSVNVAAIHTTSMAFTIALYYLAARPEIVEELRKEVGECIEELGWTKAAMGKMRKLDSFLKETQRVSGTAAAAMTRKVLRPFTFSNGTSVPAGTLISTASYSLHHDEEYYKNPMEMDPFRFSNMRVNEGEGIKHQMVTPSSDFVLFGAGKHACPGRFFAVNELKCLVSHLLLTYDVKFEDQAGGMPKEEWYREMVVPNRHATVLFRKRQ
ncbi:cytochrome P450 [Dendrothele bispora CBS 962.96]|uniref:Cytochrome P450 n=1 Tax=Dendrothele bispora (strain CBS 962.96) TaxID=1314807 RepID=A0A4S8MRP8_DENBC|nr:cytochrome P450 [Dendrothele bispora CBS 962.96]